MRWQGRGGSGNIEDRRGMGVGGGLGIGGIAVALIAWFLGFDPMTALNMGQQVSTQSASHQQGTRGAPADETGQFVSRVLGSTEEAWGRIFRSSGGQYRAPTLVLFEGRVSSACGMAGAAMGPFYCPQDEKLYIDLSFFRDLQTRFKAPGDFAQAYVIAHEVGHHVQNISGRLGRGEVHQIETELQADCLAGAWAQDAERRQLVEVGDIDEALNAAAQIGDDTIQRKTQGRVQPETWTHGSAAQRSGAFKKGYRGGVAACL